MLHVISPLSHVLRQIQKYFLITEAGMGLFSPIRDDLEYGDASRYAEGNFIIEISSLAYSWGVMVDVRAVIEMLAHELIV